MTDKLIESAYNATMEAYAAVEQLENASLKDKKKYEALANAAIEKYIHNRMPDDAQIELECNLNIFIICL